MPSFARHSRTSRTMPVTKTACSGGSASGFRASPRFDFAIPSGTTGTIRYRHYNSCTIVHSTRQRQARPWPTVAAAHGRAPLLVLDRIVGRDDVKAVDLPALRRHIGLAGIDEVVELLRVEIRMLRIGVQVGLDDQNHAERMREEPTLMRDIRFLGIRMLNRHGADLS